MRTFAAICAYSSATAVALAVAVLTMAGAASFVIPQGDGIGPLSCVPGSNLYVRETPYGLDYECFRPGDAPVRDTAAMSTDAVEPAAAETKLFACPDCGAVVADWRLHDEYHDEHHRGLR